MTGIEATEHPKDEPLLAYAAGELPSAEAKAVAGHLADCPACAATVARYRMARDAVVATAGEQPSPAVLDRAKALFATHRMPATRAAPDDSIGNIVESLRRVVAGLAFDGRMAGAFAGFRSDAAGEAYQLAYESELAAVDLEIEATPGDRWRIMGQISPTVATIPATVALTIPGGGEGPEAEADAHGFFSLQTAAGRYELEIRLPDLGAVVVVPDLVLG